MNIKNRLKSPVVWAQIISIVVGVIIYFAPQTTDAVRIVSTAVVSIMNIFAGLNNPTDQDNF